MQIFTWTRFTQMSGNKCEDCLAIWNVGVPLHEPNMLNADDT